MSHQRSSWPKIVMQIQPMIAERVIDEEFIVTDSPEDSYDEPKTLYMKKIETIKLRGPPSTRYEQNPSMFRAWVQGGIKDNFLILFDGYHNFYDSTWTQWGRFNGKQIVRVNLENGNWEDINHDFIENCYNPQEQGERMDLSWAPMYDGKLILCYGQDAVYTLHLETFENREYMVKMNDQCLHQLPKHPFSQILLNGSQLLYLKYSELEKVETYSILSLDLVSIDNAVWTHRVDFTVGRLHKPLACFTHQDALYVFDFSYDALEPNGLQMIHLATWEKKIIWKNPKDRGDSFYNEARSWRFRVINNEIWGCFNEGEQYDEDKEYDGVQVFFRYHLDKFEFEFFEPSVPIGGRYGYTLVANPSQHELILYGGFDSGMTLGDLYKVILPRRNNIQSLELLELQKISDISIEFV